MRTEREEEGAAREQRLYTDFLPELKEKKKAAESTGISISKPKTNFSTVPESQSSQRLTALGPWKPSAEPSYLPPISCVSGEEKIYHPPPTASWQNYYHCHSSEQLQPNFNLILPFSQTFNSKTKLSINQEAKRD